MTLESKENYPRHTKIVQNSLGFMPEVKPLHKPRGDLVLCALTAWTGYYYYIVHSKLTTRGGGVLSEKVDSGMCGPDRVLFRPLRFSNSPILFENWFRYRWRFCKMHNFR